MVSGLRPLSGVTKSNTLFQKADLFSFSSKKGRKAIAQLGPLESGRPNH